MDYFKKIERSVTISADKRSTVDLQVDVWSQDLNVTKFILKLDTTDSAAIDLTNATVRVAMVYSQDGTDVKIEESGIVEDVATQKIAYVMGDRLAGFEGQVTTGFYVTLSTGQRIDIQNVTFNMRKSLLDKDLDVPTEDYYQTFDDILADVESHATTQKSAIDGIVSDVQTTGDSAKTQIGQVLPDVQSKVSAINAELAKIDENMPDLFVAYADDLNGSGFSKTDSSKLYKGFSVKNSTNPSDYRWERNVDSLQVGGRNLLKKSESNLYNAKITKDTTNNLSSTISIVDDLYLDKLINKSVVLSFYLKNEGNYVNFDNTSVEYLNGRFGAHVTIWWANASGQYTFEYYLLDCLTLKSNGEKITRSIELIPPNEYTKLANIAVQVQIGCKPAQDNSSEWFLGEFKLEEGNTATAWSPALEDLMLNTNPINSVLTTLSSENPSTTLGGTWTQLGTESKFNQTIYYWQRTQ